jgi:hypothetical protein
MPKKNKNDIILQPSFICSCRNTFNDKKDMQYHKSSGECKAIIKELLTIHFD